MQHGKPDSEDKPIGSIVAGGAGKISGLEINLARIDAVRDIRAILHELQTDAVPSESQARDEASLHEATEQLAAALNVMAAQQRDVDLSSGKVRAIERLLMLSGNRLLDAARRAASAHAAAGVLFVFRRMLAVHSAIEAVALGAEEEANRALASWRLPSGNGTGQTANIRTALDRAGGPQVAALLAARFLALLGSGADGATLNQTVRQAVSAASPDDVRALWINGLLAASPEMIALSVDRTHRLMRACTEAGLAGAIARQRGGEGVSTDAATATLFALIGGSADAFVLATRDIPRLAALPLEDTRFDLARGGGALRVVDFLNRPLALSAKLGDSGNGVLKALGYRMMLRNEAYRRGTIANGTPGDGVAALIVDPPADLHLAAIDTDTYAALTDPKTTANRALRRIRDAGGASHAVLFLVPFLQEPEAIGRFSFDGTRLAPLVARWRGEVSAGSARRDLALAQAATSAAILAIAAFSHISVTDPSLGDPVDQVAAFVTDCNAIIGGGEIDPDDVPHWSGALAGAVLAVAQLCTSRSFLRRFAHRVAMVGDAADEPQPMPELAEGTPLRAVADQLDRLAARMTARRGLWGEAAGAEGSAIDDEMLHQGADATPIGKKTDFAGAAVNFRDWPAAYEEYRRLAGNGLKHPEHGLGARDFLDAVVQGKSSMSPAYRRMSDGPQGSKAIFIRHTIGSYRRMAQQKILGDRRFRDFAAYVQRVKALKDNPRSGGSA